MATQAASSSQTSKSNSSFRRSSNRSTNSGKMVAVSTTESSAKSVPSSSSGGQGSRRGGSTRGRHQGRDSRPSTEAKPDKATPKVEEKRDDRDVPTVNVERLKELNFDSKLRESIEKIAQIDPVVPWVITDASSDGRLYMVHHKLDHDKIPFIRESPDRVPRGVVVDIERGTVVARGYPKEHRVELDEIVPNDNLLEIWDNEGILHDFNLSDATDRFKITPAMDGFVVLVYKHNGVIYYSTYKLLDADRAHIGQSDSFLEMYFACGGPAGDFLFEPSEEYSPYVYIFLVAAPQLAIATRQYSENGYVAWLGTKKLWPEGFYEGSDKPRKVDFEVFETELGRFSLDRNGIYTSVTEAPEPNPNVIYVRSDALGLKVDGPPFVYVPPRLTLGQANYHLKYGYLPSRDLAVLREHETKIDEFYALDPRSTPGEQVFLLSLQDTGETYDLIQVQSQAYVYRESIRKVGQNLTFDFANVLSEGFQTYYNGIEMRTDKLMDRYVLPESSPVTTVKSEIAKNPKFIIPLAVTKRAGRDLQTGTLIYTHTKHYSKDTTFDNVSLKNLLFLTYLYALPPSLQLKAVGVLDRYNADLKIVKGWLSRDAELANRLKMTDHKGRVFKDFETIIRLVTRKSQEFQKRYEEKQNKRGKTVKVDPRGVTVNWDKALTLALNATDPVIIYKAARFIERANSNIE
jgi:hypothetical protein